MNRARVWIRTLAAGIVAGMGLGGCSFDPYSGGTETGNPELGVAALLVYEAVAPAATLPWSATGWIPGGMQTLDSSAIMARGSAGGSTGEGGGLAKRWVARGDTVIDGVLYIRDTLFIDDTIVRPLVRTVGDTTVVADTLLSVREQCDTLQQAAGDGADTVVSVHCMRVLDSIFVFDTLVLERSVHSVDTFLYRDTVLLYDTISLGQQEGDLERREAVAIDGVDGSDIVHIGGESTGTTPVMLRVSTVLLSADDHVFDFTVPATESDTAAWYVESTVLVSSVTKVASREGLRSTEHFADRDGDGLLFHAAGSGRALLAYTGLIEGGDGRTATRVDYGAGEQGGLSAQQIAIASLHQHTVLASLERTVRYQPNSETDEREFLLTIESRYGEGERVAQHLRATLRAPHPLQAARHDTLVHLGSTTELSGGTVRTVRFEVTPLEPLAPGAVPDSARVTIEVLLADGSRGVMEDALLITTPRPRITGYYRRNGEGSYVSVDGTGLVRELDVSVAGPRVR